MLGHLYQWGEIYSLLILLGSGDGQAQFMCSQHLRCTRGYIVILGGGGGSGGRRKQGRYRNTLESWYRVNDLLPSQPKSQLKSTPELSWHSTNTFACLPCHLNYTVGLLSTTHNNDDDTREWETECRRRRPKIANWGGPWPGLPNGGAGGVRGGNYDMTMDWWTDDSADWAMSGRMMKLTDGDMS